MKHRHAGNLALWVGVASMMVGASLALAAAPATQGTDQSKMAARLLREIKTDGMHVQSAAAELNELTQSSGATWLAYDQQWNEIKPSVEDMQIKLGHLESLRASATPAQRTEIDQSKQFVQDIQNRTAELRALLDSPGVRTTDMKFKTYARSLMGEAGKLERIHAAG